MTCHSVHLPFGDVAGGLLAARLTLEAVAEPRVSADASPPRPDAAEVAAGRTSCTCAHGGLERPISIVLARPERPPLLDSLPLVGVAQLVELLVVVQAVGGSSPLAHPLEVPA